MKILVPKVYILVPKVKMLVPKVKILVPKVYILLPKVYKRFDRLLPQWQLLYLFSDSVGYISIDLLIILIIWHHTFSEFCIYWWHITFWLWRCDISKCLHFIAGVLYLLYVYLWSKGVYLCYWGLCVLHNHQRLDESVVYKNLFIQILHTGFFFLFLTHVMVPLCGSHVLLC